MKRDDGISTTALWVLWLVLALATAMCLISGWQERSFTLLLAAVFGGWSGGVVSTRLYDRG